MARLCKKTYQIFDTLKSCHWSFLTGFVFVLSIRIFF